jgi:hypothetical protein
LNAPSRGPNNSPSLSPEAAVAGALHPVAIGTTFTGRPPGLGRWEGNRYDGWTEVVPYLVVEVSYTLVDVGGQRFRHPVRLLRFRPDRDAETCTAALSL